MSVNFAVVREMSGKNFVREMRNIVFLKEQNIYSPVLIGKIVTIDRT